MKATGVVRQVDQLGRIVLPIELRRTLGVETKDSMEIFVDGEQIILRKYAPGCVLCGESEEGLQMYRGHSICPNCLMELKTTLAKQQAAPTMRI